MRKEEQTQDIQKDISDSKFKAKVLFVALLIIIIGCPPAASLAYLSLSKKSSNAG